jgi:hypothetical protein
VPLWRGVPGPDRLARHRRPRAGPATEVNEVAVKGRTPLSYFAISHRQNSVFFVFPVVPDRITKDEKKRTLFGLAETALIEHFNRHRR